MQTHARVVVIGGGVIGCSVLYHLTKHGWTDVVLIERKELTAGSSWHAAGGFHSINGDANIARLQGYTCGIYPEIQEISEQDVGGHYCGGLLVAATETRWEFLRAEHARRRVFGLDSELVTPDEVRKLCPIMDTSDVLGALFDPLEGYLDPSGATFAYAKAARKAGAQVHRYTKVEGLTRLPSAEWEVRTDKGTILAEHVVNCAGLWAREVGEMAGVQLPLIPIEHHYLITEDVPDLKGLAQEIPQIADLDGGIYLRQEHHGVLLGVYERGATPWALPGTPWDYAENELLIPNLERLGDDLIHGFTRFPAVANAGIKRIVNGPFTFSPDGNPLVGPIAGLPGYWVAAGCMAGFAQGGGVGRTIAEWIIDGQPSVDVFGMDIARFDPKMTPQSTIERACEFYSRRFDIPYPNESWPSGRPGKTTPLYDGYKAKNAVFASAFGMEVPAYFAPEGEEQEVLTFRRSNAFPVVGEECRAVRETAGVVEISAVAKFMVQGDDAEAFVRRVVASPMPGLGQSVPGLLLSAVGKIIGDLHVAQLAPDRYLITGPTFMQAVYMRWFDQHRSGHAVTVQNISDHWGGLFVAGPQAAQLLDRLTDRHRLGSTLTEGRIVEASIGHAPCLVLRTDRLGEIGFELFTAMIYLHPLYRDVMTAGQDLGVRDIGVRAYSALTMECTPGITLRELSQDHTVVECGYERLLDQERSDYIGCKPALEGLSQKPERRLVGLRIDALDADASGDEPIWIGEDYVGHTSSGNYGHTVGYSMALAFLDEGLIANSPMLEVTVLGERRPAQIVPTPFYTA